MFRAKSNQFFLGLACEDGLWWQFARAQSFLDDRDAQIGERCHCTHRTNRWDPSTASGAGECSALRCLRAVLVPRRSAFQNFLDETAKTKTSPPPLHRCHLMMLPSSPLTLNFPSPCQSIHFFICTPAQQPYRNKIGQKSTRRPRQTLPGASGATIVPCAAGEA